MGIKAFFKKAFSDMKESTKSQHEVDKANFAAAKAEAKANFEENRGHNTFAKAKADAKKSWDDAHMSPSERTAKIREENAARVAAANERTDAANARAAKQKAWLSICGSLGGGMLLFMMVSMITPLGSTIINVVLCAAGGAMFAFGLGAASNAVLKKTSLV